MNRPRRKVSVPTPISTAREEETGQWVWADHSTALSHEDSWLRPEFLRSESRKVGPLPCVLTAVAT